MSSDLLSCCLVRQWLCFLFSETITNTSCSISVSVFKVQPWSRHSHLHFRIRVYPVWLKDHSAGIVYIYKIVISIFFLSMSMMKQRGQCIQCIRYLNGNPYERPLWDRYCLSELRYIWGNIYQSYVIFSIDMYWNVFYISPVSWFWEEITLSC